MFVVVIYYNQYSSASTKLHNNNAILIHPKCEILNTKY